MELKDYNLYSLFLRAVEFKNYTRVAEAVGLSSHKIVSEKMVMLEQKLGVKLFVRAFRSMEPTSDALVLYDKVKKALQDIDMAENNIREFDAQSDAVIKIICTTNLSSYYLVKPMRSFAEKYPKVQFDIAIVKGAETTKLLRNGEADLVISILPIEPDDEFESVILTQFSNVFFASSEFAREHGISGKVSKDRFAELPFIATRGFAVGRSVATVDTHELLFKMVTEGHGVGRCIEQFLDLCHPNADVIKFEVDALPVEHFDLQCICRVATTGNATKAFLEHLSAYAH